MKEQVDVRNHAYRNNERNRKLQDSVQLYIFLLSFIYLLPNFHLRSQLSNLIYLVSVTEHIGLCSIIYYIPLAEEQFVQVPQDFIDGASLVWSNLIEKQIEDRSGFSTGISISPVWRPPSLSVLQLAPCWSLSICLTFRRLLCLPKAHPVPEALLGPVATCRTRNAIFFFLFETQPYFVAQDDLNFPVQLSLS